MGIISRLLGLDTPVDPAVAEAVEYAVNHVDPRLRIVGGYEHKLQPSVVTALEFANQVAARVPGPVEVSAAAWSADPLLRLLFATADDIPLCFSESREVQAFCADARGLGASHVLAILGSHRAERNVLGVELEGETLHSGVSQRTVDFSTHAVMMPAADEQGVREELKRRVFNFLLNQALERIKGIHSEEEELEQEHAILETRLRLLQQKRHGVDSVLEPSSADQAQLTILEQQLAENGRELEQVMASIGTLDRSLQQVQQVLERPGDYLSVAPLQLRVDSMNCIVEGPSSQPVHEFRLLEASLKGDRPRSGVILIARFPRGELRSREQLLEDAERYL